MGIEYVKAIIENNYNISINHLTRTGNGYNETKITKDLPSALAIRRAINNGKVKKVKKLVPPYVYSDLPNELPSFDSEILFSILSKSKEEISLVTDCSEGLENKIKSAVKDCFSLTDLISKVKSKRYTEARLKRILFSAMLGITKEFTLDCLNSDLYLKVLAINKDKQGVLSDLSQGIFLT